MKQLELFKDGFNLITGREYKIWRKGCYYYWAYMGQEGDTHVFHKSRPNISQSPTYRCGPESRLYQKYMENLQEIK